jgi:N utilization substance protein A
VSRIVFDALLLKTMALFESVTGAKLRDCIASGELLTFVVEPQELGRAVGSKGKNVRHVERLVRKKVRVVEFSEDCASFIKNLVYPVVVSDLVIEGDIVTIMAPDQQARSWLIGRNASRLRAHEAMVKRYFPIRELRVK